MLFIEGFFAFRFSAESKKVKRRGGGLLVPRLTTLVLFFFVKNLIIRPTPDAGLC